MSQSNTSVTSVSRVGAFLLRLILFVVYVALLMGVNWLIFNHHQFAFKAMGWALPLYAIWCFIWKDDLWSREFDYNDEQIRLGFIAIVAVILWIVGGLLYWAGLHAQHLLSWSFVPGAVIAWIPFWAVVHQSGLILFTKAPIYRYGE